MEDVVDYFQKKAPNQFLLLKASNVSVISVSSFMPSIHPLLNLRTGTLGGKEPLLPAS